MKWNIRRRTSVPLCGFPGPGLDQLTWHHSLATTLWHFTEKPRPRAKRLHWNLPDVLWFSQQSPPWTFKVVFRPVHTHFASAVPRFRSAYKTRGFSLHTHIKKDVGLGISPAPCSAVLLSNKETSSSEFRQLLTTSNYKDQASWCVFIPTDHLRSRSEEPGYRYSERYGKECCVITRLQGPRWLHPASLASRRGQGIIRTDFSALPCSAWICFPNSSALETGLPTSLWEHCNKKWN